MHEPHKQRKRKAAEKLLSAIDRMLAAAEDAKRAKRELESKRQKTRRREAQLSA